MSDSLTIDNGEVTRRPRRERPEREPMEVTTVIESGADPMTPESALADSREQLQAKDREVADGRRREREATQRAQALEREVAQAREGRVLDQHAVVAQALEGAKSSKSAAQMALRAAREAGNFDAEMTAIDQLSAANNQIFQATGELEMLKTRQPEPARTERKNAPGPEAQRWIDEHPRFNTDTAYKQRALAAHAEALTDGMAAESPAYFRHINNVMEQYEAGEHGDGMTPGGQRQMNAPTRGSTALPPSRGNNGQGQNGYRRVQTDLGGLLVQDRADGTRSIRFADRNSEENFREGAMLDKRAHTGPEGLKKALADYVNEHVVIAQEIAAGGNGDLVRGEGRTYKTED